MSDTQHAPNEPAEPVRVTLALPAGLVRHYDGLVEQEIYPDRESALLHAVVESWRYNRGSFHRVRLDIGPGRDWQDDLDEPAPHDPEEAPEG